jgi:hypothetical protein
MIVCRLSVPNELLLRSPGPSRASRSAQRAKDRHIDRSSREAPSPLGPALYVCHPRPVNGYIPLADYLARSGRRRPARRCGAASRAGAFTGSPLPGNPPAASTRRATPPGSRRRLPRRNAADDAALPARTGLPGDLAGESVYCACPTVPPRRGRLHPSPGLALPSLRCGPPQPVATGGRGRRWSRHIPRRRQHARCRPAASPTS